MQKTPPENGGVSILAYYNMFSIPRGHVQNYESLL